jgi:hypothetical protein
MGCVVVAREVVKA